MTTKYARSRREAEETRLHARLFEARAPIEKGRMSRKAVWDAAAAIAAILTPMPAPFIHGKYQSLSNQAHGILNKTVADVSATDVKELNDQIDAVIDI